MQCAPPASRCEAILRCSGLQLPARRERDTRGPVRQYSPFHALYRRSEMRQLMCLLGGPVWLLGVGATVCLAGSESFVRVTPSEVGQGEEITIEWNCATEIKGEAFLT